jgi:hypothetical protein
MKDGMPSSEPEYTMLAPNTMAPELLVPKSTAPEPLVPDSMAPELLTPGSKMELALEEMVPKVASEKMVQDVDQDSMTPQDVAPCSSSSKKKGRRRGRRRKDHEEQQQKKPLACSNGGTTLRSNTIFWLLT